jgi:hypothetical protein
MVTVGKPIYFDAKVLLELHLGILVDFSSYISVLSNNHVRYICVYVHTEIQQCIIFINAWMEILHLYEFSPCLIC